MAGVSRSVTIVVAYLLKKYKYTLEQIMSMMHRRRRKVFIVIFRLILILASSGNSRSSHKARGSNVTLEEIIYNC